MEKRTAHFDITHSKRSCIAAGVVTALLLAAVIAFADSFLSQAFSLRVLLFIGCLVAPLLIGALIAFRIKLRDPVLRGCAETVLLFLLPVVTIIIMETFLAKMRRLQGVRKVLLLEEAWKAIAKEGMASYVKYLCAPVQAA